MANKINGVLRAVLSSAVAAPVTDRHLLARFNEGDQAAFEAIVKRYTGLVLGVCHRILPTIQDAEDACQATFLILARKAKTGSWQTSIANWLYTTARRVAFKASRAVARRLRKESSARASVPSSVLDQITGREMLTVLDEELDKLPAIYREPLVLCYLQGLTRDEAALRLGIPFATLKCQLERGRRILSEALTKRGIAVGVGLMAVAATSMARASSPRLMQSILATIGGSPPAAVAALAKAVAMNGFSLKTKLLALAAVTVAMTGFGLASMQIAAEPQKPVSERSAQPPAKDDVRLTAQDITERGSLEAVKSSDVVCRVGVPGVAIKWIIADGTKIKKGDKLAEIEDAYYVGLLKKQQTVVAEAEEVKKRAAENLVRIKDENLIDLKVAQIDVRLAQLTLKQFKGNDAAAKEVLVLQLERAGLLADRIKLKGAAKESEAAIDLSAKKAALDAKVALQRAIEKERSNCVLTAPQDGVAVLFVPDQRLEVPAVGALVYAGQKLMVVSDLARMAFHVRIPENLIVDVRQGQKATIRVDAFPKRTLTGTVHEVAEKADRLGKTRLYRVMILVDGVNHLLLPGMSGEATIQTAGKTKSP